MKDSYEGIADKLAARCPSLLSSIATSLNTVNHGDYIAVVSKNTVELVSHMSNQRKEKKVK